MRAALILLALVVVLGFVSQARTDGWQGQPPTHDYTVGYTSGFYDYRFGFRAWEHSNDPSRRASSAVFFGPLGGKYVLFTATQGLIGFCLILAMLIIVPVVLTVRWRRRAAV